jgi:hypothetical protein
MTLDEKAMQVGIGHVAGIGLLGHKSLETIAKSVNASCATSRAQPKC